VLALDGRRRELVARERPCDGTILALTLSGADRRVLRPMPYVVRRFEGRISHAGLAYRAEAWAAPLDHRWQGGVRFICPEAGVVLTTGRETVQCDVDGVVYWAAGLRPVYLDGALRRAADRARGRRQPAPLRARLAASSGRTVRASSGPTAATGRDGPGRWRPGPHARGAGAGSAGRTVRVRGLIDSIVVARVVVVPAHGEAVPIDLAAASPAVRRGIRPGDGVDITARFTEEGLAAMRVRRTA
jgi:hypothetical protein